ncbi:hypothetical protein Bca52824_008705 [Brassica carinata]|uniref:Uncharacterized protein n=1 Tax=Brassica carinata TaxID=52824 RepID=A0A8X8B9H4_BRACI|nr:hypothetical protein Bca52824_008705 [Brassica carinata]
MCVCRIYSHDACTALSLIPEESSMVRKEEGMVVLHSDLTEPSCPTVLVGGAWRVLGPSEWSPEECQRLGGEHA